MSIGNVPSKYKDPVTHELLINPVKADDGNNYEKDLIVEYMRTHSNKSPMTGQVMSTKLIPNTDLKNEIVKFNNAQKANSKDIMININDDRKTYNFYIDQNATVISIKKKVFDITRIPENNQTLIHNGKILYNDSAKLKDVDIVDDSLIFLGRKQPGG